MPSPVRDLILQQVADLLTEHRVVVWYDANQACAAVFDDLQRIALEKVDARRSVLQARRLSDRHWSVIADPDAPLPYCKWMLVYVPWARATTEEARVQEPFEVYARLGAVYGADPMQSLGALARTAMPHRKVEVDRLLSEHREVTLEQLEALAEQGGFPFLKQAIGTDDPKEVAAHLVAAPEQVRDAVTAAGVQSDLVRLLGEAYGFESPAEVSALRSAFVRWVLFSEFAFDLADIHAALPAHTAQVKRAAAPYRTAIYALCDRLRGVEAWRDAYIAAATEVERDLQLGGLAGDASSWGERDTFAAEDSAALRFVQAECLAGRLDSARRTLDLRKRSIWLREPSRSQLWQLASRALSLLEAAAGWRERAVPAARAAREHLLAYSAESDGLWQVDRSQRWMERAGGDCVERELLQPLIERAQEVYRQVIDAAQSAFLDAVVRDGWPPEGPKQTQVFARHVAPALQDGGRVAYFLMDALRYEMGRDLGQMLETLGAVQVEAAATVVPTTTPFGMAALLPGAEASFGCEVRDGELWPTVGGKAMITVNDRRERFREQLGDRCVDVRLDELLDASDAKLRERIGRASLIVVRSDDIDKAGEGTNLPSARRFISSILDDTRRVAQRLARVGVTRMVFAADHGHVLLPEVLPGDVVRAPPGEWLLAKRRCRLGNAAGQVEGVRVLPAPHLGVHGPVKDVVLTTGFRVFTAGAAYFHEGMSLQECLVPAVVLDVSSAGNRGPAGLALVEVITKHPRFIQRIFNVKLKLTSIIHPTVDVRVAAIAPGTSGQVGQAADCDARDPATGLIHLRVGTEETVMIRIDDDFDGKEVVLQVLDAGGTGVVLGSIKLKNDCLE
jgi:PglZ domain